jgi:hypothetical protein
MRRETRANLIFLGVLLCLMGPPIAMTIARRWGEPQRRIEPPQKRDALAFIDRTAGPASHMPRVVPPELGAYVAQLGQRLVGIQRGLRSLVGDGRFAPIMSDKLYLQWVGEGERDGQYLAAIVGWDGKFLPLPSTYRFSATRDGRPVNVKLESYETLNMPIEIRRELQSYGYILPPDGLIWMILSFEGPRPVDEIAMHFDALGVRIDDTLPRRRPELTAGPEMTTRPTTTPATAGGAR